MDNKKIKIAIMADAIDRRPERALFGRRLIERLLESPELEIHLVHYRSMPDDPLYHRAHEIILPRVNFPFGSHFLSFLRFCLTTKERFDIFHWLVGRPYPFFWLAPAAKIIVTAHDAGAVTAPGIFTVSKFIFNLVMRYASRYLDAVIGVSDFAKEEIIQVFRIPREKVFAIYNGINQELRPVPFSVTQNTFKNKYGVDIDKYFLYLGGLQTHKNVRRLIAAFNLLKSDLPVEEKLIIAGIPSYGKEEVYETAKNSPYSQDIIFINYVAVEDLAAFYSGATALVYPSLHEGFGLPVVEAMACGTPVIATNVTSLPEIAAGAALLIDPLDPKDIMAAMRRIKTDQSLCRELIARGKQRAALFSWDKYASEHVKLYKKTLDR